MINDSETIVFIFLKLVAIPPTAPVIKDRMKAKT